MAPIKFWAFFIPFHGVIKFSPWPLHSSFIGTYIWCLHYLSTKLTWTNTSKIFKMRAVDRSIFGTFFGSFWVSLRWNGTRKYEILRSRTQGSNSSERRFCTIFHKNPTNKIMFIGKLFKNMFTLDHLINSRVLLLNQIDM